MRHCSVVALLLSVALVACREPSRGPAAPDGRASARPAEGGGADEGGAGDDRESVAARVSSASTKVVLLGTGTPRADPDRSGPAVAVVVKGRPYLVDCGAGVVRRAAGAARAGVSGLEPRSLSRLFVTHLHSDHTLGYPDVILSPWVLSRREPLVAVGPPGLRRMTDAILEAYAEDIGVRTGGLESLDPSLSLVDVREVEPGEVYRDALVAVRAFPVKHGSWPRAYGYRFEAPDRTVVVSGDTSPTRAVVEACDGCDVLVHEVYAEAGFDELPPQAQRYHSSFHTSTAELAALAREARPRLLVLYHQLGWPQQVDDDQLEAEVRARWDGEVVSGRDLGVY